MRTDEAGRELDALVAEKVMGWTREKGSFAGSYEWQPDAVMLIPPGTSCPRHPTSAPITYRSNLPHYSTEIGAAWLVVELMARRGWKVDVQNRYAPTWACHVNFAAPDYRRVFEHCETAPLAICRAALDAVIGVHSGAPRTTDVPETQHPATESGTPGEAEQSITRNL